MTDDRAAFTEARDAGKAIHQAQRLENATYTAVEVKALTKTAADLAYALGRKEAAEEIAAVIAEAGADRSADRHHKLEEKRDHGRTRYAAYLDAAKIARDIGKGDPT